MSDSGEPTVCSRNPGNLKRWAGGPKQIFGPGGRRNGGVGGRGHAGVTLESAGVIDGEEEDDVPGSGIGRGEEGQILFLGGPRALVNEMGILE